MKKTGFTSTNGIDLIIAFRPFNVGFGCSRELGYTLDKLCFIKLLAEQSKKKKDQIVMICSLVSFTFISVSSFF